MTKSSGFKWACFISYRHGEGDLSQSFIKELYRALQSSINANFTGKLNTYLDEARLRGGDIIDHELATNLCKSVCMIMVFTPFYFDSEKRYCSQEYKAMEMLEEKRSKLAGEQLSLIIPIIFKGIPPKGITTRKFYDFTKYSLLEPEIIKNPQFYKDIEEIAQTILQTYLKLESKKENFCGDCLSFTLPKKNDNQVRSLITKNKPVFPR